VANGLAMLSCVAWSIGVVRLSYGFKENIMKYRIEKRLADFKEEWYFPQYYEEPYFFGLLGGCWKDFIEWKGCDPLGFDYGDGSVYFKEVKDAKDFIKKQQYKNTIITL
jgi:hypothetical protein